MEYLGPVTDEQDKEIEDSFKFEPTDLEIDVFQVMPGQNIGSGFHLAMLSNDSDNDDMNVDGEVRFSHPCKQDALKNRLKTRFLNDEDFSTPKKSHVDEKRNHMSSIEKQIRLVEVVDQESDLSDSDCIPHSKFDMGTKDKNLIYLEAPLKYKNSTSKVKVPVNAKSKFREDEY